MSDPAAAFAAAIGRAARALREAQRLWADHPRAIAPLVAATDGPPFRRPWDAAVAEWDEWAGALRASATPGAPPPPGSPPAEGLEPADPATAFVAALGRAVVAIGEADAAWAEHPRAIDALVGAAPYPKALPSFDEFAYDFLAWVEVVADREAALRAASRELALLSREEGPATRRAAATPPPLGPGWDPETAATLTRFEVWGTTLAAPVDWCEFRGFAGPWLVRAERMAGY